MTKAEEIKNTLKIKLATIKVKDKLEERKIKTVSSQIKQGILHDAKNSVINLVKKKNNGCLA